MNFRHGVGGKIDHRNPNIWKYFPTFHASHFRSIFLHYFHHEQGFKHVQDYHQFFCDLLVTIRIPFLHSRKGIICDPTRMKSNPIFQRRQLRLLVLFLAVAWIQHVGSIYKFSRIRKQSCQKMQINWRKLFNRQIFVSNEQSPMFELFKQNKSRKSMHKWIVCQSTEWNFERFFIFQSIWQFLFLLRF